jgi:hypothetical protein
MKNGEDRPATASPSILQSEFSITAVVVFGSRGVTSMKSRGLRVVLVLLAMAGLGGAGYFAYLSEARAQAARSTQRLFERDVARLQAVIAEVRGSLPGYVAAGQDPAFWAGKMTRLLQDAQARAAALERNGISSSASQHIGTAEEAIAMLQQQDARVRDLLEEGQAVEASRLIFRDAVALSTAASLALSEAATLQADRTMAGIAAQRWNETYALGGAAGLAFLVLLLLVPRAVIQPGVDLTPARVRPADSSLRLGETRRSAADLDLQDEFRRPSRPPAVPVSPGPAPAVAPPPVAVPVSPPGLTPLQLEAVAALCTDLVRVADADQLQQLLERAATLLDATGLVIWLAVEGGAHLRPAFSFGYGPQALARIQTLGRNDDSAVSDAFREGRREVVAGKQGRSGALVMPLLSASGCVGVMAAETRAGSEARPTTQALAAILAAQLTTLMPSEEPSGK